MNTLTAQIPITPIDQDAHRPGAALALSSQPAARFQRHQRRRPYPETFSEEQS